MTSEERAWIEARIARTKTLIVAYEDALEALESGVQQYSLDTGQSRQMVTRQNISSLQSALDRLEARLARLQADLCGRATIVRPTF